MVYLTRPLFYRIHERSAMEESDNTAHAAEPSSPAISPHLSAPASPVSPDVASQTSTAEVSMNEDGISSERASLISESHSVSVTPDVAPHTPNVTSCTPGKPSHAPDTTSHTPVTYVVRDEKSRLSASTPKQGRDRYDFYAPIPFVFD